MTILKLGLREKFESEDGEDTLLSLNADPPDVIKIVRLLAGTIFVVDEQSGDVYYPALTNYVNADDNILPGGLGRIVEYIFEESPDVNALNSIFLASRPKNRQFYSEVLEEIKFLLKSLYQEKYTEAFLYLYRLLERISAACPLVYISRERDFRSAHSFLSTVFDEKKSPGELWMLQKFLLHYASVNDGFSDATLDFGLSGAEEEFAIELLKQLRSLILPEVKSLNIDDENGLFSIPFKDVSSFVVSIRNRTFHNLGARANFNLVKLGGSEPLFALLVPVMINWFSYVFVDFAKWQLAEAG